MQSRLNDNKCLFSKEQAVDYEGEIFFTKKGRQWIEKTMKTMGHSEV
jgi:hypothetical protein